MASISRDPNGTKRIFFHTPAGKRKAIRLGKVSVKTAETIKTRVERLTTAAITNDPIDNETARWVAGLEDSFAKKLSGAGLIPERNRVTLSGFISDYTEKRRDVKPATKTVWQQGEQSLVEYFGADRPVTKITTAEAEDFKQWLIGKGLAKYTVRKRLQVAKMFFTAMVQRDMIPKNPFNGVQVAAVVDESRNVFVSSEDTKQVMQWCPDAEWRAIVALCRYGGLRCPSEVLSLRWDGINWAANKITIISPKTAHHPDGGQRVIPLFPELVQPLTDAWEAAPDGAVYVITRHRSQAESPNGWKNSNLRTRFYKIIKRAGFKPWPKPFHALRASRETELVERFPVQVVAAWLGNSPKVALKHYLRVLPEHYEKATQAGAELCAPNARLAQNCAQKVPAKNGKVSQASPEVLGGQRFCANTCETSRDLATPQADGEGFEPPDDLRRQQFSRLPP